jgi:Zn-finger nucleic acid-binding protein
MDRNAEKCPACGWRNTIACPSCDRPLTAELHDGLRLDVCRKCRGVWFDHVELAAIWTLTMAASRGTANKGSAVQGASFTVAEVLMYSPDLLIYGAHTAGMAIEGGASVLANAPEAAIAIAEGAGDVAASAFEAVLNVLAELFS